MPLTRAEPPIPVKATHIAELEAEEQAYAEAVREYLRLLFQRLILPHTEWAAGTGSAASGTSVTVQVEPSAESTERPSGTFTALPQAPAVGTVSGQRCLVAYALSGELREAPPTMKRYFDGAPFRTVRANVPAPPTPTTPAEPAAFDMTELDEDTYRDFIAARAQHHAEVLDYAITKTWLRRWRHVTRWLWGVVTAVQTAPKTATVALSVPDSTETPSQSCGFGTRVWTVSQLAGEFVRVGADPRLGYWVDDLG